ncbi:MAG TPA: pitrilysin family protein [Gemmataceae bacterium]|nr:pitrilysin family protein [Gemmataceae bacterium]
MSMPFQRFRLRIRKPRVESLVLFAIVSLASIGFPLLADEAGQKKAAGPLSGATLQAAAAFYDGIRTETLPNGLRVYLKPVPESPVVTTMVAYKVGSADENLDHTGLSHYLEHLMFKGTDKIMPGDIDRLTLRNGGANNASTSEDCTEYHFDFASDRWQAALQVEADRMHNLRIDTAHEFEQEKGAVISELESDEDEPWDLENKAILPLLFGSGPYGHPVIGERAHVRGATAAVIQAHYTKWYHPNNAVLVVCGGFDPDQAMARIKELFGPIPRAELPERKPVAVVKRQGSVRKEIPSKFDVPRMVMGFNTVRSGDPDFYPLQVIQSLLTSGKTGRLYRKLVEGEELASAVDSTNNAGRYPGWFEIQVELLQGKDRDKAEQIVLAELKSLCDQPIRDAELKRIKTRLLAGVIFGRESVHALAESIARGVTINDLDFLKSYLPRIQAVTAQDIQAAAQKFFDPEQRVVVWSVPKTAQGKGARTTQERHGTGRAAARRLAGGIGTLSLQQAQRVELPNGLTLLLLENHRLPIVVADATLRRVTVLEPEAKAGVAAMVGDLLDEGSTRHTGPEIADLIENVGGSLSVSAAGGSVKVLAPERSLGLGVLFECLSQATFPQDAFAREQAQQLSAIADAERRPDAKAQMEYRRLAYGKHPYGRPQLGRRDTVQALTPEDCRTFYRQVFVPNNTIVAIVGDFDSKQVIDEVTRLTAEWKRSELPKPELPAVEKPKEFTTEIVTIPAAAQLHFFMGHAGIRRDNPDYFKLLVMDYVLGTGPGFTDRLSARLRDRQGLAYTVSAGITSSASEEPGLFTCYIGTNPQSFERVKAIFLEEMERLRNEKPTDEEVEDVKKYLTGSLAFRLTTNAQIASQLVLIERYHLGLSYLDNYRKAVNAVTPADVQAMAHQYLDPQHMVLVAAGALDQNGKPLENLPPPKKPGDSK